jgi:type VI secretion system protein VasG
VLRRELFGKLSTKLFQQLESATTLARERGDPEVSMAHWLLQMWHFETSDLRLICEHFRLEEEVVLRDLSLSLARRGLRRDSRDLDFSAELERSVERAWLVASVQANDQKIRSAWLLIAMLQTPELCKSLRAISGQFEKLPSSGIFADIQHLLSASGEAHDRVESTSPVSASAHLGAPGSGLSDTALSTYCIDLTELAKQGHIDPVVGRDRDIRFLMDVLLRRKQNNPLLVGEAGVGKTAIVEGLALAIALEQAPTSLLGARIMSLDLGSLLAGAAMRGEFEARLRAVLDEAMHASQATILFVDEVHTLVGAGGQAGTGDAANLLKPALARGQLRVIGSTTWSEYKRHIEKDPALTRRFQAHLVEEPDDDGAIMMVRSLVGPFQRHHRVHIQDEAVRSAVVLSRRYLPARQLPDKAISLLDTACARVSLAQHTPPSALQSKRQACADLRLQLQSAQQDARLRSEAASQAVQLQERCQQGQVELDAMETQWTVLQNKLSTWAEMHSELSAGHPPEATPPSLTDLAAKQAAIAELWSDIAGSPLWVTPPAMIVNHEAIAEVVSEWTGVPAGQMLKDDMLALAQLQSRLGERVLGQSWALGVIADRVKAARVQLTDPGKPLGVFMLVGPSGVGKTETALSLAEEVYGGMQNLITINMSEYQEAHTVSSLKGSPPGYVGFGEGGVLTEAVRRRPYSVILLDEIEKAHPDVHEIFYQVFDKGWMDDGEGRTIDFTNTLILLTSNCGSELIQDLCADASVRPTPQQLVSLLDEPLRATFPAAFLGRISVVPYLPLEPDQLMRIARMQLAKVSARALSHHGLRLDVSDAALRALVEQCGVHDTGARRISKFIEQYVLPSLAQRWLDAQTSASPLSHLWLDWKESAQADALDPAGRLVLRPPSDDIDTSRA